MKDPVTDDFGNTYEREALEKALRTTPGVSPQTGQNYPDGNPKLHTNYEVKSLVNKYLEEIGFLSRPTYESSSPPSSSALSPSYVILP